MLAWGFSGARCACESLGRGSRFKRRERSKQAHRFVVHFMKKEFGAEFSRIEPRSRQADADQPEDHSQHHTHEESRRRHRRTSRGSVQLSSFKILEILAVYFRNCEHKVAFFRTSR
jgi:hypothetical protein